ncbi:hypothetical protein CPB84DRAFT_833236 [Gymnopilus junonius]|uniref:Uncharacterized protein n=1 Tax=Gymnopilus junonius TaxID=109634 RepID=A0A9P5TNH2_GYMJU|nr:hypothetical protein CPB84DRAFT_833236 [Gymnopilus junonius]
MDRPTGHKPTCNVDPGRSCTFSFTPLEVNCPQSRAPTPNPGQYHLKDLRLFFHSAFGREFLMDIWMGRGRRPLHFLSSLSMPQGSCSGLRSKPMIFFFCSQPRASCAKSLTGGSNAATFLLRPSPQQVPRPQNLCKRCFLKFDRKQRLKLISSACDDP